MSITVDTKDLEKGILSLMEKTDLALMIYAETAAKDFESYAKANRPWTDRTSRARQGLTGYTEKVDKHKVNVCIAHTVDYGVHLEYAHEKKYAILEPTVRLRSKDVLEGLKSLFKKIKGM